MLIRKNKSRRLDWYPFRQIGCHIKQYSTHPSHKCLDRHLLWCSVTPVPPPVDSGLHIKLHISTSSSLHIANKFDRCLGSGIVKITDICKREDNFKHYSLSGKRPNLVQSRNSKIVYRMIFPLLLKQMSYISKGQYRLKSPGLDISRDRFKIWHIHSQINRKLKSRETFPAQDANLKFFTHSNFHSSWILING